MPIPNLAIRVSHPVPTQALHVAYIEDPVQKAESLALRTRRW